MLKQKQKETIITTMDNSDIRFTFDYNFKIKEVLAPQEFVKFTVDNLPDQNVDKNLVMLGLSEDILFKFS